jgi:hypothetical protein
VGFIGVITLNWLRLLLQIECESGNGLIMTDGATCHAVGGPGQVRHSMSRTPCNCYVLHYKQTNNISVLRFNLFSASRRSGIRHCRATFTAGAVKDLLVAKLLHHLRHTL